jgi:colanic acid/amylovoran biosynthesis protein
MTANKGTTWNILIINSGSVNIPFDANKGAEAVMVSTFDLLRKSVPDCQITSLIPWSERLTSRLGLRVVSRPGPPSSKAFPLSKILGSWLDLMRAFIWGRLQRHFNVDLRFLVRSKRLREYADADIIIHLSMDTYHDESILLLTEHSKEVLTGVLLKKPVLMWAGSIGPFKSKLGRKIARFTLNRTSLITVREQVSKALLQEAGVMAPPIHVTADPAFLLRPASQEKIDEIFVKEGINKDDKPFIGVIPAQALLNVDIRGSKYLTFMRSLRLLLGIILPDRIFKPIFKRVKLSRLYSKAGSRSAAYRDIFAQVCDHIIEELGAMVILIPHDFLTDDKTLAQEIHGLMKLKDKARLITNYYDAEEIKGIIGQCDLVIGAKMHANIAALSQSVPAVALASSFKFRGIMAMLGQEEYVCQDLAVGEVITKVNSAWTRRSQIANELKTGSKAVEELALLNGRLVEELTNLRRIE